MTQILDGTIGPLKVLLTDYPWPDTDVERQIIEGAGFSLVVGPSAAGTAEGIEQLVAETAPHAILTCWAPVSAKAINSSQNLRIVARMGVGLDNIAVESATERGAWVTNVPDYCVEEVSDHAVALLLAHERGLIGSNARAKQGLFTPGQLELRRLSELTVGIIGFGRIGRRTAQKLRAFGCRLLANTHDLDALRRESLPLNTEAATLQTIQAEADVIILHAPLTPATAELVNGQFIAGCRRRPLLVNVSRGGLVNNEALVDGLDKALLRAAALDVIDGEPNPPASILKREDVVVTPHIGYCSSESLHELRRRSCEEVVRVLRHEQPHHACNRPIIDGRSANAQETALTGGVASDIRIVHAPDGPYVVKRALEKLKVAADWFSDPSRSSIEVEGLRTIALLLGQDSVPKVLWTDEGANQFAMELIGSRFRTWKQELLRGNIDNRTAAAAGRLLGQLHSRSAARPDLADKFRNTKPFVELRIRPFFDRVAQRNSSIAPTISEVVANINSQRIALVHGDYSPKNLLVDGEHVVILDCEVMHWGDPRFDVAFCAVHLLLKAFRAGAPVPALIASAVGFLAAYRQHGLDVLDHHFTQQVGCLLLARLEGDSPVEYLAELDTNTVKALAMQLICDGAVFHESAIPTVLKGAA